MIPLRDRNPSGTTPYVSIGLILLNVAAFFYQLSLGQYLNSFLFQVGLVPSRVLHAGESPDITMAGAYVPFLTSMFFHGGWLHIIGNMWYLWIFGDNVEDRLGHGRFFVFYLLCGIAAGIIHALFNLNSAIPTIGASGAIAGVLGAYLVSFPRARILTAIPIFVFIQIAEIPAIFFLVFWFILQFFSGALSVAAAAGSQASGGVAWWAHIGGFVCGIALVFTFSQRRGYSRSMT